jgi:glycosyltransferase involved in cell wall biosynthesis
MAIVPVLILSDAVSASTGLGRIAREIAIRADQHLKDVCRIATLGYGGPGSRQFKFQQYSVEGMGADWVIPNLPEVWEDWAGNEPGAVLCIWDASRLGWFSRPNHSPAELPDPLKLFLVNARMQRWVYTPVDAEGPNGKLAYPAMQALLGFDRILAYGRFGESALRKSLGDEWSKERDLASIPHGVRADVFYPRDRAASKAGFFSVTQALTLRGNIGEKLADGEVLIGTIATNQARKDWGLWAAACSLFLSRHPKTRLWVHIDRLEKEWSIPQLLVDFGLLDRTVVSLGYLDDEQMAQAYSACDLTLGIGPEGWGFPLAESLACGTPVIHGNCAGGVEVVDNPELLVEPAAYRFEGLYCCRRPVYNPGDWADRMDEWLGRRAALNPKFYWKNNWPLWEQWFRKGLAP